MKILIIQDELVLNRMMRQSLEDEFFIVESAANLKVGIDKIIVFILKSDSDPESLL